MKDQLTLFAGDTLASHSVLPGSEQAGKMTAISGLRCLLASGNTGRLGYLEKMLLGTSAWASTMCFLTWKVKATPAGHSIFQLAVSAHRTKDNASGLWATPRSCSAMASSITPERAKDRFPNLEVQVARIMYPTPTASMHKGSSPASLTRRNGRDRSNDRLDHNIQAREGSGSLNPDWVEALMGFPPGWTEVGSED